MKYLPTFNELVYQTETHRCFQKGFFFASYKMPEFFNKSPFSKAEKHHNFKVTLWHHFDTTSIKFDDWWRYRTL